MNRARFLTGASLVVLALVVLSIVLRSDSNYEVKAVFDDVRGLIEGGEVKAGGVNVGTVSEIEFTDSGYPRATMTIDSDYQLNQGAFANIRLSSNVGAINRFVELTQGEGPELADGATLGPSQTDQPVDFDVATSTLDPKTRAAAGRLLANLDDATVGRGDDLSRTLKYTTAALGETANLLAQVTADRAALATLVTQGRTVVSALAESPGDLGSAAENLSTALTVAAARQAELRRTVEAIGPGLRSARSTLDRFTDSVPNLREVTAAAAPAVAELKPTAQALAPVTAALVPLAEAARRVAAPLEEQLEALRPAIAATIPLAKRLPTVLDGLNPLLDHMRARAPEVVGFFTLFGDATSNYDVNGNLIRVSTILIQNDRHPNEIPATSDAAGSVVKPYDRYPGTAEGEPWEDYFDTFIGGGKKPESYLEEGGPE